MLLPKEVKKYLHTPKSFIRETESAKDLIFSYTWKLFENETGLPVTWAEKDNNICVIFSRGNGIETRKFAFLWFFSPKAYL